MHDPNTLLTVPDMVGDAMLGDDDFVTGIKGLTPNTDQVEEHINACGVCTTYCLY